MWHVLLESTPLTLILAFTWSFLYTVCIRDQNLNGQLSFSKILLMVVKLTMLKAFSWSRKTTAPFFVLGFDEVDEELDINDVCPHISCGYEPALVVAYLFGKDRAHPVGPYSYDYFVVNVEERQFPPLLPTPK